MFQRSAGVSPADQPGIAVPRTPTEIRRYMRLGLTSCMAAAVPIAGGTVDSPRAAGPFPWPAGPWQLAQSRANRARPAARSSPPLGNSSAPAVPSACWKRS